MIYHQSKLMMQPNKYIPKIGAVKYSADKEFQQLSKHCEISEYPTTVLFDAKAKPLRTVIGCSWF